jgi:hypothetical protein
VLESHVRLWLQSDAGTEDVGERSTLLGQGVDDWSTRRSEGCLEHVAQDAEDAVETSKVLAGLVAGLPLNTSHHLSDENEIDNQRRSQERILADVEDADGLVTAQEDLRIVLIQSTFVVSDSRHVLDHNAMVRVLALLVEDGVGSDHVIDHVGLGDFLGTELLLGAQVLAIVVAEMVVRCDGGELDTGVDEEVDKGGLHLGLARLEVVTADESLVLLGELDAARNKGVLGRTVDEGSTFENTSDSEDGGRSNLLMSTLDGVDEVVGSVVDAGLEVGETLGVGGPQDNDLLKVVGSLEVAVVQVLAKMEQDSGSA